MAQTEDRQTAPGTEGRPVKGQTECERRKKDSEGIIHDPFLGVLRAVRSHGCKALALKSHSQVDSEDHEECIVVFLKVFLLLEDNTCFDFLPAIVWEFF